MGLGLAHGTGWVLPPAPLLLAAPGSPRAAGGVSTTLALCSERPFPQCLAQPRLMAFQKEICSWKGPGAQQSWVLGGTWVLHPGIIDAGLGRALPTQSNSQAADQEASRSCFFIEEGQRHLWIRPRALTRCRGRCECHQEVASIGLPLPHPSSPARQGPAQPPCRLPPASPQRAEVPLARRCLPKRPAEPLSSPPGACVLLLVVSKAPSHRPAAAGPDSAWF